MSLVLLGIFIVAYSLSPTRQRKPMMLSGLLSIPWSLASISFVPDYWHPERVVTFLTGFEDIIFSFANGGTVWLLSIWIFRNSFLLNIRTSIILKRYIFCSIFGIVVRFASRRFGIGVMASTIIAIVILGVFLIAVQRNVWPLTLTGMSTFTIIYMAVLFTIFTLWPEFIGQWNTENLWGIRIIGIPLEEIVWAAAYGGVWPILMAYVFDLKWSK
jgi:hypothetical protein